MRIIITFLLLLYSIASMATEIAVIQKPKIPYKRVCDCTCSSKRELEIRVDGNCSGLEGSNCAIISGDNPEHPGTLKNCSANTVPVPREVLSAQRAVSEEPDIDTSGLETDLDYENRVKNTDRKKIPGGK